MQHYTLTCKRPPAMYFGGCFGSSFLWGPVRYVGNGHYEATWPDVRNLNDVIRSLGADARICAHVKPLKAYTLALSPQGLASLRVMPHICITEHPSLR